MKDIMLFQSRPLGERLDPQRQMIFAWNAGIRAYNCADLIVSQWQMFNP
jgi:hypothetical protein